MKGNYCQVNEIILALDSGILYEAKVLKIENVGGISKYFIHYQGWARKYDLWADEAFIAKKGDQAKINKINSGLDGVKIKAKVEKKVAEPIKVETVEGAASQGISTRSENATDNTDEKKDVSDKKVVQKRKAEIQDLEALRKHRRQLLAIDLVDEDDENFVAKLPIPQILKKHLTDEWRLITNQELPGRLLMLPKVGDQTAEKIVKEFLHQRISKLNKDKVQISSYEGLMEGLLVHFDKALPSILLYRQEHQQYDALVAAFPKKTPCQLYGAEHLVRLFMRMPRLLSNVFLPAIEVNQILAKLGEFIKFISKAEYIDMKSYVSIEEAMANIVEPSK